MPFHFVLFYSNSAHPQFSYYDLIWKKQTKKLQKGPASILPSIIIISIPLNLPPRLHSARNLHLGDNKVMAPIVFPHTAVLWADYFPSFNIRQRSPAASGQLPIWMVTNTGAWSEIVRGVLPPREGLGIPAHTNTQRYTKEHKIHRKMASSIAALGEALALPNLITTTLHRWI